MSRTEVDPLSATVAAKRLASIPVGGFVDATAAIQAALDTAAGANAGSQYRTRVLFEGGDFRVEGTILVPSGVSIVGVGPTTRFIQVGAAPVFSFANVIRGSLEDCFVQGQGIAVIANRVGTGIVMSTSQFVDIRNVQVWDFARGIDVGDGSPFTGYASIRNVEVNRCTSGIRALQNSNVVTIQSSRVFFSYGAADEGVGIDIDSASAISIIDVAVDGADECIRIRNAAAPSYLQAFVAGCYFEPGTNPDTLTVGSAYDIELQSTGSDADQLTWMANQISANRYRATIPPSSLHRFDTPSREFFGAAFDGGAQPKRNYVRNGRIDYYNPAFVPGWAAGGGLGLAVATAPGEFFTGVRSFRATATTPLSSLSSTFVVTDDADWITVCVRYRVLSGAGFLISAQSGNNLGQYADFEVTPANEWRIAYVQVRVDPDIQTNPALRAAAANILPDAINGVGECLVDEVWAVPGRHAVVGTQYGERIEMLDAPITVLSRTGLVANDAFGPVDLLTLPATLAPPLDDFSTAPRGVIGAILRLRMNVTGGAGALANQHWAYVDIPAAGGVVPATVQRVVANYGALDHEATVILRDTSLTGGAIVGDGFAYDYSVALVGWIVN